MILSLSILTIILAVIIAPGLIALAIEDHRAKRLSEEGT